MQLLNKFQAPPFWCESPHSGKRNLLLQGIRLRDIRAIPGLKPMLRFAQLCGIHRRYHEKE